MKRHLVDADQCVISNACLERRLINRLISGHTYWNLAPYVSALVVDFSEWSHFLVEHRRDFPDTTTGANDADGINFGFFRRGYAPLLRNRPLG
jgi:hypothetical protein